jgi:acetoacetate decarboxylase
MYQIDVNDNKKRDWFRHGFEPHELFKFEIIKSIDNNTFIGYVDDAGNLIPCWWNGKGECFTGTDNSAPLYNLVRTDIFTLSKNISFDSGMVKVNAMLKIIDQVYKFCEIDVTMLKVIDTLTTLILVSENDITLKDLMIKSLISNSHRIDLYSFLNEPVNWDKLNGK